MTIQLLEDLPHIVS